MVHDALEVVKLRNDFYRDSYRKLVVIMILAMLVIGGLTFTVVYMVTHRPMPTYFASTDTGRIIPLIPLDQPNLTDQAVVNWASKAVVAVYTYDFINFRQTLQENEKYFTQSGWRSFLDALNESKNLDAVRENKMVVSAFVSAAPIVTRKGVLQGRYVWVIQIPLLVHFASANQQSDQNYVIQVQVWRVSTLDNPYGVGIMAFNVITR